MIDYIVYCASWFFLISGSFFYIVGAIGLVRMPDLFTRMHAVSVSDSAGTSLLMVGMMLQYGWSLNSLRLGFIMIILLYGGSVVSHSLARAALFAGVKPVLAENRANGFLPHSPERQ